MNMIVVADSGSTKCDWILTDKSGNLIMSQTTDGINPVMFNLPEIKRRIVKANKILKYANQITQVYFYSAGCGLASNQELLRSALENYYSMATVEVESDLVAAVRATGGAPSIVCILGTGSNSCYFDGKIIHQRFDSLGYSVMDEASGSYFGKMLLRDYFYKKMPVKLALRFEEYYEVNPEKILLNLYKKPMPAQYLASYAKFIFDIDNKDSYISHILKNGFEDLIDFQLQIWKDYQHLPIHFIGSIAFFAEDILKESLSSRNFLIGKIIKNPIDKLLEYHVKTEKLS